MSTDCVVKRDKNNNLLISEPPQGKTTTTCIGENRATDELRSSCEADQRLPFSLQNFQPLTIFSVTIQPGFCRTL